MKMVARISNKRKESSSESSSEEEEVVPVKKQQQAAKKVEYLSSKPAEKKCSDEDEDEDEEEIKIHKKDVNHGIGEGTQTEGDKKLHKRLAETAAANVNSAEAQAEGAFEKFKLPKNLTDKLEAKGIKFLYPIQIASLEPIREGHDIIAQARTGTGKTVSEMKRCFYF